MESSESGGRATGYWPARRWRENIKGSRGTHGLAKNAVLQPRLDRGRENEIDLSREKPFQQFAHAHVVVERLLVKLDDEVDIAIRRGVTPGVRPEQRQLTNVQIANAVYHATGKRIRDLPITIEKVM